MVAKLVDSKGRISLDKSYAGATMLVDQRDDGTIILRPAVTVPANEAWLWKNKKALAMVQEGLNEARQGRHVAAPDMAAARKLAARIKD
jgi:predicted transcriptional regulator